MASPSDLQRPVALVTGLDGFTGHYVARQLELVGYQVHGLALAGVDGTLTPVDLLDKAEVVQAVEEVQADVVVHLAAISFVAHDDANAFYRVNVLGTRNLLESLASVSHAPRAVVLASSANIYGRSHAHSITEDTPPLPANDYAVSKLAMEYVARLWMDRLPIVIVRPFNYTGVGQDERFLIPKIVAHFRRRAPEIELGNIHVWRDFSDVRTVADAYARLVVTAPQGRTLNICSGKQHSLQEVLAMMADIAGYRIAVRVNPRFVRDSEVERLAGSNGRLVEVIGAQRDIALFETLRWMYSSLI